MIIGFSSAAAVVALNALLFALLGSAARATELVRVENATRPSRCAENDNVYVKLVGAGITHFTIEARHPAYIASLKQDDSAADFTNCDQSHDPTYSFSPLDLTLFEDADYKLVGHRFARFWRPENVDFRVGNEVTHGLHLVQLIRKLNGHNIEILVVYPSDGYWRMKPLPPDGVVDTTYGSSFLAGPVEEQGRPFVPLEAIAFDRSDLSFHLSFKNGEGALRVAEATRDHTRVEVTLPPSTGRSIFAALRSMFVSPEMADAAEAVLESGTGPVRTLPILDFPDLDAASVLFARTIPSRHNTSAPDIRFGDFGR